MKNSLLRVFKPLGVKRIGSKLRGFALSAQVLSLCGILGTGLAYSQTLLINPAAEGGFESGSTFAANGWTVANGAVTNQWYVGTAATGYTGNAAYISADAGATNGYTNSSVSVVHFYRDVTVPAGENQVNLSFAWKALGESGFWDALMVSVAPTSYVPTASNTSLGTGFLAAPAIEVGRYWNTSTVQTVTVGIPASVLTNCSGSNTFRLIFSWKNDGSGGTNPSASVDNISLTSQPIQIANSGGVYTIDNTLATGGTNFANFTAAINSLNAVSGCLTGPVTFNVASGQTFSELPPVITATGTASNTITFQKSGTGANPVIVSVGTASTGDATITLAGGDYFTFDGIDINNSANIAMEYGYLLRNASATNGCSNNLLRNFTVRLSRASTNASIGVIVSSVAFTPSAASGANSNNTLSQFTVDGAYQGVLFNGGSTTFPDAGNKITTPSAGMRNSIINIGPSSATFTGAKGVVASSQSGFILENTDVSAVAGNQSVTQGIFVTGNLGTSIINGNKVSNVSVFGSTTTTNVAYGIQVQNATTGTNVVRISNNMISDVYTSFTGTATSARYAIGLHTGIASATSAQSYEIYNNSISIGSGLTPTYSNSTFEIQNVNAVYKVRNNIFANFTGAQAGAARHYTWVTTSATSIGATGSISDNNDLFVANGVGTSGFVARANTNEHSTLVAWTSAITAYPGTDANSTSIDPQFVNNLTDLHLNLGTTPSRIESGGASLGVATDFDGQVRPGPVAPVNGGSTAPDMGADEFDGVPLPPPVITLNSVTPPTTAQCTATARLVSANVTTASGTITNVTLAYAVNGTAQTPITMTNTSGSTYQATIPVPTPANATISWSISALNSNGQTTSYVGTPYSDEPLFGYTSSALASNTTVCSGSPTNLSALINNPAAPTTYTTPAISFPTADEDLRTVRITQGATTLLNNTSTVNSLTGSLGTATGTAGGYSNFTAFAPTTLTGGQTYTLFVASRDAVSTYYPNYATAFIDFNRDGDFADAGESLIPASGLTFNAATDNGNDSISVSFTVPVSAVNGMTRMRVSITEDGQTNAAGTANVGYGEFEDYAITLTGATPGTSANISSVTWMDGATTVGTGNPLTVNPTASTTYTANITALGCSVSPSPTVSVTVNPLPTAPTATNSTQCGTAVPTASVSSTSGLPTPTFNWYAASTGGSALQSSTSTTYASNVSSTTTFYVSELNTSTGCESARVPVTVTVGPADPISATATPTTICIGSSVTLTAANTAATPTQTYTYSWTGVMGSGLSSTPTPGTSITVTPVVPGTYTYDVNAVDGGCTGFAQTTITVNPFTVTLAPVNVTCNGYNNGSFTVASTTCGTADQYAVDGGSFSSTIPTNLTPGTHTVIVRNTAGYDAASQTITITEPSTTIATPTGTNAAVCQNGTTAPVSASSLTNTTSSFSQVVNFTVAAQPTEASGTVPASPTAGPNLVASATMTALPAGAVVTGATLNYNNIVALGSSWQSDVRLGLDGAISQNYTAGTGSANGAGTFNYVSTIPGGSVNVAGGTVNLHYFDFVNDNAAGAEATFTTGTNVASITINYTLPNAATISWYDASTGGTLLGTGSPFEAVGTSVLPNTATPGTYTLYAQGEYSGCSSVNRAAVTVTVNALPTVSAGTDQAVCAGTAVTLNGSGAVSYTWTNSVTNGTAFTPVTTQTYTVTGTDANGCQNTDAVVVTVNALPGVYAGTDEVICNGDNVTLTASGATSYIWNNGVVDGMPFAPTATNTYTVTGTDANGCQNTDDVVVTVNQPTTSTTTLTACDSYVWHGNTYTANGTYTFTGTNAAGCDSVETLILTINQSTNNSISVTNCDEVIVNGISYTTSGTYTQTLTNAVGCDSVLTIVATVLQNTSSTQTVTACSSYTWSQTGQTYMTTGLYQDTLTNAAGCDSIIFLNLTINMPTTATVTVSACDSYTWPQNGMTYMTSGMYNDTLVNAAGCDSIVTLDLTIGTASSSSLTVTACDSFDLNGTVYTGSGAYTQVIPNASGCDSTITLILTINQSSSSSTSATACGSYTWAENGVTYTSSGAYTYVTPNAAGCDSTITLNLTINALPTATANFSGGVLTASAGSSYEWIDCATGLAIGGATSQTYTPTANGSYSVVVTNASGCSDTSACVAVTGLGVKELNAQAVNIYPNPTHNVVTIDMTMDAATVEVRDAAGKLLQIVAVVNGDKIDLSTYDTGVYFLNVKTENGSSLTRVVKN